MRVLNTLITLFVLGITSTSQATLLKYPTRYKNGIALSYMTQPEGNFLPGIYLISLTTKKPIPLDDGSQSDPGVGHVWFLETPDIENIRHTLTEKTSGRKVYLSRTPPTSMAFVGIEQKALAISQEGAYVTIFDFSPLYREHPDVHFDLVTAPETVSVGADTYRAIEFRAIFKKPDGGFHVEIGRGIINQDFAFVPLPPQEIDIHSIDDLPKEMTLGKTFGERGRILTIDHVGFDHDQKPTFVREQIYAEDFIKGGAYFQNFPLTRFSNTHQLPLTEHFQLSYAHESVGEFRNRVFGMSLDPKPHYQTTIDGVINFGLPEPKDPYHGVRLSNHGQMQTAVSFASYHRQLQQDHDLWKPYIYDWPVIEYKPLPANPTEAQVEHYYASIDAMKAYAVRQAFYMVVPDVTQGQFRLHHINADNARYLSQFFVRNYCDELTTLEIIRDRQEGK